MELEELGCWRRNRRNGGWRRRGAGLLVLEAENQNGERGAAEIEMGKWERKM